MKSLMLNTSRVLPSYKVVTYNNTAYTFNAQSKVIELRVKKVFLSYSHFDSCIANIVDNKLSFIRERSALCYQRYSNYGL